MNYNKKSVNLREKKLETKKTRKKQKAKTISFYVIVFVVLFMISMIGGLGLGVFRGILASAPDSINVEPTGFITTIYDSDGKVMEELSDYTSNRIEVSYDQIPENLRTAFIAIEDERFYDHK